MTGPAKKRKAPKGGYPKSELEIKGPRRCKVNG